ncbi:prolyl oligopeptidase family serine peptidase [Arthrobacter sp. NPDC089319]|uniref:alpha/beta hydrolase n=1 Tax=Arthrobacter sp. NPDC089319 TaxID=3155915 RepID=UPI003429583E
MDTPVEMSQTIAYGSHSAQRIYCYSPANPAASRGLAILVHGGYWRAQFDASLMNPLATDLCSRGWAVANVEYRRGAADSAWPDPRDDVDAAIRAVTDSAWAQQFSGSRITIGHSVGGQLVLLSTAPVDGVVALAPVTDVARTYAEDLAEGAVVEYFGAGRPDVYHDASPLQQTHAGTPTLVVHGDADLRVPLAHTHDFVRQAQAHGAQIELSVQPGMDHVQLIDPQADHWPNVLAWMQTRSG